MNLKWRLRLGPIARPNKFFIYFFLGGGGSNTPLFSFLALFHYYKGALNYLVSLQTVPFKTRNFLKHDGHNAKLVPGKTFGNMYKISRSIHKKLTEFYEISKNSGWNELLFICKFLLLQINQFQLKIS